MISKSNLTAVTYTYIDFRQLVFGEKIRISVKDRAE